MYVIPGSFADQGYFRGQCPLFQMQCYSYLLCWSKSLPDYLLTKRKATNSDSWMTTFLFNCSDWLSNAHFLNFLRFKIPSFWLVGNNLEKEFYSQALAFLFRTFIFYYPRSGKQVQASLIKKASSEHFTSLAGNK